MWFKGWGYSSHVTFQGCACLESVGGCGVVCAEWFKRMDSVELTGDIQAAIMTIKERIELASGPEYHALDYAERETEILLSTVVSVEDCLPIGAGETIIGAIRGILTSIQEFKNVCGSRHI